MAKNDKRSGNPAKRAQAASVASAKDFKTRTGGFLTLPSGLTVKVRSANGMKAFIEAGQIPNSLLPIVQEAIDKGKQPDPGDILTQKGELDTQMMEDMLTLTDRVVCKVVISPPIHPMVWTLEDYGKGLCEEDEIDQDIAEDRRDEDTVYVDEVEENDKMFLFQWATGGTRSVERFRSEFGSTMDDLARQQIARGATE